MSDEIEVVYDLCEGCVLVDCYFVGGLGFDVVDVVGFGCVVKYLWVEVVDGGVL